MIFLILSCIYYLTIAIVASLAGGILTIAYAGYTILEDRKKKSDDLKIQKKETKPRFFINFAIANLKDVKHKRGSSSSSVTKSVKKTILKSVTGSSGSSGSDECMRQMSHDVIQWIQTEYLTMEDDKEHLDVNVVGNVVRVQGGYAVLSITLESVNLQSIVRQQIMSKENKDRMSYMDDVLGFLSKYLGEDFVQFALDSQIKEVVKREVMDSLGEEVKRYLKKNWSAKAVVVVSSPVDQSALYFDLLQSCSKDDFSGDVVVRELRKAEYTEEY